MVLRSSILILIFFSVFCELLFSQGNPVETPADTVHGQNDSIHEYPVAESEITDIINYIASDSAVFDLKSNQLFLYNKAELTYQDMRLTAGKIVIDRQTQILDATGVADSTNESGFSQLPVMIQGSEVYEGSHLTYNFKTRQGSVSQGFTEADVGYYFGDKIKRVAGDLYYVKGGLYTTSSYRVNPEYFFSSPEMKIIPNDKIIARSVFLYIEGVPVFWVPFAVFPNKKGRNSGIITPTFGDDGTYGNYIAGLGYFWAINDYMDINATLSYFTKGRLDLKSKFRYALRYNFSGGIEAGYSRIRLGEDTDPDKFSSDAWMINIRHNQRIDPTLTIDGNVTFTSGKSYFDNITNNLNDLLRQNIVSNFTLTKFWEGTPFSLSLNYFRDQNLQTGDINERLPSINFSNTEVFPFRSKDFTGSNASAIEYLSYSYNLAAIYNRQKINVETTTGVDSVFKDSRPGVRHDLRINFTPPFDFITIRPFFNYTELWYDRSIRKYFEPADSSVLTTTVNRFEAVRFFNTGISLSSKLIGIFTPEIFNITGIRHTITPSISYSFQPDFSSPGFGYYGEYKDAEGDIVKYSHYEGSLFGGAPASELQSLNFSIGNLFEMKTLENDTTENKFQLFNLNTGLSYNFAADSLRFSELFTDFRTAIGGILNIGGSARFNFYKFYPVSNRRINTFLWDSDGKLAELTSFSINLSTGFNFGFSSSSDLNLDSIERLPNETVFDKLDHVVYDIPVSVSFNYNYSENKSNPFIPSRISNLRTNLNFSLTRNWKFTASASYDFIRKEIGAPYITAYRDLNSWEMLFNWYPTGFYRGFRLEIRIKAPDLRDIKITKETNSRGAFSDF